MVLTQDKFYYKYGIRKPYQILEPIVVNLSAVALPYYSAMHILNAHDDYYPTRQSPLFNSIHDAFILNILEYEPMVYKVPQKIIKEREYVKDLNKKYVDFTTYTKTRFLHILTHRIQMLKKTYPVFLYKDLGKFYKYLDTKLDKIHKFENKYATVVKNIRVVDTIYRALKIKNNEYSQYLIFEIPNVLYDYNIIHKFLNRKKLDSEYLKIFHNDTYKLLLELFKLLYKDTQDKSILKDLIDIGNINFIFKNKQAGVIINLKKLLSFNKDLNKAGLYSSNDMLKYMITMFNTIINSNEIINEGNGENKNTVSSLNYLDEEIKNKLLTALKKVEKNDIANNGDIDKIVNEINEESDNIVNNANMASTNIVNTITYKNKYETLKKEEIVKDTPSLDRSIKLNLDELKENGKITDKKYKQIIEKVESLLNSPSPFNDDTKIKDNLKINKEELKITDKETKLPEVEVIYNKKDLHDPNSTRNKKYLANIYKKDIISSILHIQNSNIIVEDIVVEPHEDTIDKYDTYYIKLSDVTRGGGSTTVQLLIPRVDEDGVFTISNNQYRLRQQKTDIVIKKINYNRVSLTTAYGKLFVDKAPYKKLDRGYDLKNKLLKLAEKNKIKSLAFGNGNIPGVELPSDYTLFGRYIKSFQIDKYYFNFNYKNRKKLIKDGSIKLENIESNGSYVLCGNIGKDYLVIDKNNIIYRYNGKYNKIGTIWNIVPINTNELKHEYSMAKIYKNYIPVAYLLTYYMGINNLLKTLGVKYKLLDKNKRVDTSHNEIVVKLEDQTLILYPNNSTDRMILEGFNNDPKIFKEMNFDMLNNKEEFVYLFREMGLNLLTITEIKALETLFVDPVSKTILEEMGEPTTFIGLLIRASELLINDNYIHPNSLKGYTIRGYERIPQAIYKTLVNAIKKKMSGDIFSRSRIEVDPYAVWRYMNEDNSGVLVDDINPIAFIKQKEDTTMLGEGGRAKDTIVGGTRAMHEDDVGVISESSKDSSDVGITAYLSANPKIKDLRGLKGDDKNLTWSNVLSTSAMLAPFATMDDPKRVLYINIQNSHIIPIDGTQVYPVRTGYESVFPYRVGKKYIGIAEDDGKVIDVEDHKITIQYKKLGKKTYTFNDWTSKEESNTSYVHKMATNLKKGENIVKDDILYYDKGFFDVDMFNNHRVVYRASTNVHTALMESSETYEDSTAISQELSKKCNINFVKVRDVILNNDETVTNVVKVGSNVEPEDPLLIITSGLKDNEYLTEETLDLLKGFVKTTPKAKYKGTIIKIKMYYNCSKDDLSKTLKKVLKMSEPYMDGKTGEVNSGYSIKGKPLDKGKVHIKFYIKIEESMHAADKGIVANQLKTTVADVYTDKITTEDGIDIDILFSLKGIYARIVNSSFLMGTTASILEVITKKAVDMYFSKD